MLVARRPLEILGLPLICPPWVMCSSPSQSLGQECEMNMLIGQDWSHVLGAGGWVSFP